MIRGSRLPPPAQFREFAFPYIKRLVTEIRKVAKPPSLHICGNTRKIWKEMVETGAGSLSLDNVIDLEEAKHEVGDKIAISGNIRPSDTMFLGTPATVEQNVKECLRKAYDSPKGYILALGAPCRCGRRRRTSTLWLRRRRSSGDIRTTPTYLREQRRWGWTIPIAAFISPLG